MASVNRRYPGVVTALLSSLLAGPRPASAAFPGANGKVVFESTRDGNYEIYVMNADGTGQTRLTNNSTTDGNPTWSPDGTKIAFDSFRDGNFEIYVMNADGTGQTRVTNNPAYDTASTWSPDGTQIAFMRGPVFDEDIYIMNADGSGETRLTTSGGRFPDWSPDGTKIAFDSDRLGNFDVYVMNADGTGQTRFTTSPMGDGVANWSPDSKKIAFQSFRDGNWEIYVMNADGTGQTRLTASPGADEFPAWSPDGTKIAFQSPRSGNLDVWVMNAAGSAPANLSNNGAIDERPDWQRGFQWPLREIGVDAISQDYAQFNGIGNERYHTGLDIKASVGISVYPTVNGEVIEIQENGGQVVSGSPCKKPKKGETSGCSDHGYGNTVIIKHALRGDTLVYSQYSHLDEIAENLKDACTPLDPQRNRRICSTPVPITVSDSLGKVGRSCYGDRNCTTPHLHFEIKNFDTLGTIADDNGEFGYTSLHPDKATDTAIYIDPISRLHQLTESGFPRSIGITEDGVSLRFGPGGLGAAEYPFLNKVDKGEYTAIRKSGGTSTPNCSEGWYQIQRTDGDCDIAGNCFVVASDKKSSVPDAWVCGRFISE